MDRGRLVGFDRVRVVEGDGVAAILEALSSRGVRTVLWYGFETVADHAVIIDGIRAALDRYGVEGRGSSIWAGEITLERFLATGRFEEPGRR